MNTSLSKFKLWFDRFLSKSLWEQFALVFAFLLVALGVSYLILPIWSDNWQKVCAENHINQWLLPVYLLIDSNALNNIYMDETKVLASSWTILASSITFLLGAFIFNGFIIAIITNSLERRASNHKQGHIHYLKSGHYIIMGYDNMVPSVIAHVFEKDKNAYILLMSSAEPEDLREKLKKALRKDQLKHIIINYGHRASKDYYKEIHLEAAEQIYIVGLRTQPSHDAINVECVDSICEYLKQPAVKKHPKRITCVFEDLDTYAAFKTSEIFEKVAKLDIEFVPYNFYAGWAKQVFVKQYHTDKDRPGMQIPYPSVFGKSLLANGNTAMQKDDPKYVHLVFVGTTNFAVAFAMEAAHVLHFSNGEKVKTRITFIDKNADKEKDEFIVRNRHFFEVQSYYYCDLTHGGKYEPELDEKNLFFIPQNGYTVNDANFLDVQFEFIHGDVFSKNVQDVIGQWALEQDKTQYLSIFLAISNQRENFVLGMNMPDAVYDNEVPIFIRQDRSDNFVSNLREADEAILSNSKKNTYSYLKDEATLETKVQGGRYANIYPFGMNETAFCEDEHSLRNAKLINYLYATMPSGYQFQSLTELNATPKERIWKEADELWKGLSVALKWSNLYNAYTVNTKLAILRAMRGLEPNDCSHDTQPLNNDEIEILARVEHNRWNVEKLLMGYRKAHKNEDKYGKPDDVKAQLRQNKNRYIHHDIRPFCALEDSIGELDKEFSKYLPWIIKMTE